MALEDEEPNTAIRARTLIRHTINQLSGGLGPIIMDNLLNQELLMSKKIARTATAFHTRENFKTTLNCELRQPEFSNHTLSQQRECSLSLQALKQGARAIGRRKNEVAEVRIHPPKSVIVNLRDFGIRSSNANRANDRSMNRIALQNSNESRRIE